MSRGCAHGVLAVHPTTGWPCWGHGTEVGWGQGLQQGGLQPSHLLRAPSRVKPDPKPPGSIQGLTQALVWGAPASDGASQERRLQSRSAALPITPSLTALSHFSQRARVTEHAPLLFDLKLDPCLSPSSDLLAGARFQPVC